MSQYSSECIIGYIDDVYKGKSIVFIPAQHFVTVAYYAKWSDIFPLSRDDLWKEEGGVEGGMDKYTAYNPEGVDYQLIKLLHIRPSISGMLSSLPLLSHVLYYVITVLSWSIFCYTECEV